MYGTEALARFRAEVDTYLLPDDPPSAGVTARGVLVYAGAAALGAGIQLLRMWNSQPLDSIWAEDGRIWLSDALNRNFVDAFSTPYNGYLQGLSRLVAEPISWLPVDWYAPAMAVIGALIVSGCALFVWRASAAQIRNRYLRVLLAAMVMLLPVLGTDSLANITNSIWALLFACFFALLWRPRSFALAVVAALLVLVAALSNIGVVFLLPLWLIRLIAVRDRRDLVIIAAFAIGLALQFGLSAGEIGLRGEAGAEGLGASTSLPACAAFSTDPCWDWELVPAYAQRIVGGAVAGQQINEELWKAIGPPLLIVLGLGVVALVAVALRERRTRILVPLTVVISIAIFLVAGWQRWGAGGLFFYWPENQTRGGDHYMIVPTLLLLTAIILQIDAAMRVRSNDRAGPRRRERFAALFIVLILAGAVLGFRVGNTKLRSGGWSEHVSEAQAACNQPGSPPDTQVFNPSAAGDWSVQVPCGRLR